MQNYRLGDYIRQRRQELNLTQEQVCAGICEPVTLSRFENGRQTPSRTRINAILQRLGLPDDRYYALVTPEELEIEALKKEIVACNALKHVNEGFDKISQLEKIVKPDDQITQQFILRSKVLLGGLDKRYSSDERIQMLMQAIQMTIPNFRLSKIEDYLYTLDEMKLVNQIGNAYSLAGDNEKAADIFYRLLQYMRCHLQEMVTSNRMLPLVLYNFARSLDLLERYEESARVARNGKEACIKYGHYQVLHSCLEIEAECDFFLGKKEESAERYREAFYICKVMRYEDDLQIIRNEAKKYLYSSCAGRLHQRGDRACRKFLPGCCLRLTNFACNRRYDRRKEIHHTPEITENHVTVFEQVFSALKMLHGAAIKSWKQVQTRFQENLS